MTKKKQFNLNEALHHNEPAEQTDKPATKEDKQLKKDLEEEIADIDAVEKEIKSKPQDKRSKEELIDEIVQLTEVADDSEEKIKRALAELENIRRRRDIDVQNAHKYGIEKFIKELLPVIDSLEMALTASTDNSMLDGVKLTHKMFLDALKKANAEQIDPLNQTFDPIFHQAMSQQETKDHEPNTVIQVMQKGYILSGRIIRPALVVVSK